MVFDLSLSLSVMPLVYPPKKKKKKKSEVYSLTVSSVLPISVSNVRPSVVFFFLIYSQETILPKQFIGMMPFHLTLFVKLMELEIFFVGK